MHSRCYFCTTPQRGQYRGGSKNSKKLFLVSPPPPLRAAGWFFSRKPTPTTTPTPSILHTFNPHSTHTTTTTPQLSLPHRNIHQTRDPRRQGALARVRAPKARDPLSAPPGGGRGRALYALNVVELKLSLSSCYGWGVLLSQRLSFEYPPTRRRRVVKRYWA